MSNVILNTLPLDFHWPTLDPFLFCAHHHDRFPAGNGQSGPATSLAGRQLGQDFGYRDGWNMYHGQRVPGFPVHPHRGFETVTIVREGLVDHADSLGAAGRYGEGDVQWMTAGNGVQHSEMFPLVHEDRPNPLLLFQVWLNLPARSKRVPPHFSMFWQPQIPVVEKAGVKVHLIAGSLEESHALAPPPNSWAADPDNAVAIWLITLQPGASWTLPAAAGGLSRMLYFHTGTTLEVAGETVSFATALQLRPDAQVLLANGEEEASLLLLQGRPIGEPVAQYGPFVMNTREEVQQAFTDYQTTRFGGWPWHGEAPVHEGRQRFARHADGHEEPGL